MSRSRTLTLEQYPCGTFPQGTILQREGSFVRFALGGQPHHRRKISMPASVRRLSLERTLSAPELSTSVASDSLIRHDSYTIQVDASQRSPPHDHRFRILILSLLKLILWLTYFLLRWGTLSPGTGQSWTGFITYLMEIFLSIRDVLLTTNLLLPLVSTTRPLQRPSYRLLGSRAPTVDICVTCCGEPVEIILNTVNAAIAQDYPTHSMRIMVLDDGHDDELRAQIDILSQQSMLRNGPRLLYRSRQCEEGEASHYKSGNLQYGLEELRKLGSSEFFANLDCDMIPKKSWLRAMLPHLILDNQLGLVNPPQNYYNIPREDPLGQQTDLEAFFSTYEPLNDSFGAARCMGTGFVVRRRAIESIGGWPLVNVGEDFMLSSCLSDAGWKTAYVAEDLQYGLAPESLSAHIKQKQRWVDGAIEVHRRFGFYSPFVTSGFSLKQRIIFILQTLREYTPLTTTIALLVLPCAMANAKPASVRFNPSHLQSYVAYLGLYILSKYSDSITLRHIGAKELSNLQASDVWMSPYAAIRCLRSIFPCFFSKLHFSPSGSVTPHVSERSPGFKRTWAEAYLNKFVIGHVAFAAYIAAPLSLFGASILNGSSVRAWLAVPGPFLLLLSCSLKAAVPAWYMISPPKVADWMALTVEDEDGVRRPYNIDSTFARSPSSGQTNLTRLQAIEIIILIASFLALMWPA